MLVGFFLFFMIWQPSPAYGAQAWASITCQDSTGNTITRQVGWENENNYFLDKGNIPQHYCEGGYAGQFTTFVSVVSSDGSELDPALLYHPGYSAPAPIPDQVNPEPSPSPTPQTEQVQRTEDVSRDVERTEDVARPVEPSPEPVPVEPVAPIEPTPTATPEPEPTPERPVRPVEPTKPPEVITPTPEPVEPSTSPTAPQLLPEPTPEPELPEETISIELALEAVGQALTFAANAGLDMTPEKRQEVQGVIIPSVIVAQVATLAIRKVN